MILMVHGYGLSGSGSNLWTRAVVRALCQQGQDVHLLCQELRPENYAFVGNAYQYDSAGRHVLFERDPETPGRATIHRVSLDLLPVFVRPSAGATGMKSILDMDQCEIDDYLDRNEAALTSILRSHDIDAVHVNHAVLMSVAVMQACRRTGHPYAVMPHGSAIEYVVRRDPRMHGLASEALRVASRILILNDEMRRRIRDVFPEIEDAEERMMHVPVGVDVDSFRAVMRQHRHENVALFTSRIAASERGRTAEQQRVLSEGVTSDLSRDDAIRLIESNNQYAHRKPDAGAEAALDRVDWATARVVGYVGRLLGHKGTHALMAAFPLILARHPDARLLIAGSGPQREALELLQHALSRGMRGLLLNLAQWGDALESEPGEPYPELVAFFDTLDEAAWDEYLAHARLLQEPGRVVYTGYLEHSELSLLFPCVDVGVFPSIVKEASPLVVPEAIASGVVPIGIDQAGMAASLDHASAAIPKHLRPYMRIRPEPEHVVRDIARCVSAIFDSDHDIAEDLHAFAVNEYDWQTIARRMTHDLEHIADDTGNGST